MNRIIRQVFGTTRPKEIWGDLLTFNRLLSKPIVHIIYWCGLGLLFIAACIVLGVSVGSAIKDGTLMGILLSIPLLIGGWFAVLIGVLLWRGVCEVFLAVLSIAEDLRVLRQYQEKLEPVSAPVQPAQPMPQPQPQPVAPEPQAAAEPAPAPDPAAQHNVLEDPFFSPRFGKRDY